MSKSLGNIISPYEVIDSFGADTLRCYMTGGANPGLDINYNSKDVKIKHKNLTVLWNLHKFLVDYSHNMGVSPNKLDDVVEKGMFSVEEYYIISKLNSTIKKVTKLYEKYNINEVPLTIEELFLELSRTYIQLVRDKSSLGSEEDKKVVLYTVYNVLIETLKLFSTIAPFITEAIYQNLKKEFGLKQESIHLFDWPKADDKDIDSELERDMSLVSNIVTSALAGREKINLGVRWPLKDIIFVTKDGKTVKGIEKLGDIIKTQVNVKELRVQESLPGIKTKIQADFKQLGPDFGANAPKIIAKLASESPETILKHIEKEGKYEVKVDKDTFNIVKEHLIVQREVPPQYLEASFKNGFLYLNKKLDENLEAEGYSREVMRRVQNLRKKAGLKKSDSISLFIKTGKDSAGMLEKHENLIKEKVGASQLKISEGNPAKKHRNFSKEKIKGKSFEIFFDIG